MDDTARPRALGDDAAVVDDGGRQVVRVTGADRVTFLHRLITGNVAGTPIGAGCHALLLTIKGHIVSEMRVFVRHNDVRIVVPAGQGEAAAAALAKYAIMDEVAIAAEPETSLLALYGPRALDRLVAAGVVPPEGFAARPLWSHAEVVRAGGTGPLWLARAHQFGADGLWIGGAAAEVKALEAALAAAGVSRVDAAAAEAARIDSGEPGWGAEITPDYFPMEIGLSTAIDYAKGCYLGQEPIIRIRDRGHLNWRLVRLQVKGQGTPAAGDVLETDAKPKAGRITSAARLPGGSAVALGMLHMSVAAGSEVRVHHGETILRADVREIPSA